jgi:hypothetical protein
MSALIQPSFAGIVLNSRDALLLFTEAIHGRIPMITRRPHDKERAHSISSGNIFIYCEHNSSIKRWTDGVTWSPSRIMGNFLIYRELNKGFPPGEKKRAAKKKRPEDVDGGGGGGGRGGGSMGGGSNDGNVELINESLPQLLMSKDQERALIGSLIDSYDFKKEGLVKKTISVKVQEHVYHLVSYYTIRHALQGGLIQPSQLPQFAHTQLIEELVTTQNFRVAVDSNGSDLTNSTNSTPPPRSPAPPSMPMSIPSRTPYGTGTETDDRYSQSEQHSGYITSPSGPFTSPPILGRYDGSHRDSRLSYETSTPSGRSSYSTFMSSNAQTPRTEHDGLDMYGHSVRGDVPRSSQLTAGYPLQPNGGDYPSYSDAGSRTYAISSSMHPAPSIEGASGSGIPHGRSSGTYSTGHYGMTDPSSYANSSGASMSVLTRGFMGIPGMSSSVDNKPPGPPLYASASTPRQHHQPDHHVEEAQRPNMPFQPVNEEAVSFSQPNW